ncbi:copper-containing nitrite reductase [Halovenus halobia]|uniref:copper-containing nitrite reductase n=1 Tax=Halovenus halobia TaxID=3396622 RepID=UPI003F55EAFB
MTEGNPQNRRTVLKAAGVGGTMSVAGCLNNAVNDDSTAKPADNQTESNGTSPAKSVDTDRVAADPTELPDPVDWNSPRHHEVEMTTLEQTAEIEPGVTFDYMTFDGRIPGPMVRVRQDDTVTVSLTNDESNAMPHNVDFHAVYGPGGGASASTVQPGETETFKFKAKYPGVFVYHCAVPNLDYHISSGMYGAILVEPKDGLPEVDRELYFGQHEIYTDSPAGEKGHHKFDFEAMKSEDPTYTCLNGEAYAITSDGYGPVNVDKGERIRIFHANGGPNLTSSWHAIGNVWETFYRDGAVASEPDHYVETAPVVPGSVAIAEIDTPVPEPIKLVDHALTRVAREGLLGIINVEGEPEPEIFDPDPA